MLIVHNPEEWEYTFESSTCDYHKKHPGENWAGCTCSASVGQRWKGKGGVDAVQESIRRGLMDSGYHDLGSFQEKPAPQQED